MTGSGRGGASPYVWMASYHDHMPRQVWRTSRGMRHPHLGSPVTEPHASIQLQHASLERSLSNTSYIPLWYIASMYLFLWWFPLLKTRVVPLHCYYCYATKIKPFRPSPAPSPPPPRVCRLYTFTRAWRGGSVYTNPMKTERGEFALYSHNNNSGEALCARVWRRWRCWCRGEGAPRPLTSYGALSATIHHCFSPISVCGGAGELVLLRPCEWLRKCHTYLLQVQIEQCNAELNFVTAHCKVQQNIHSSGYIHPAHTWKYPWNCMYLIIVHWKHEECH